MYVFVEKLLRTSEDMCPCINSHSISSLPVFVHLIYLLSLWLLVALAKRGRTCFQMTWQAGVQLTPKWTHLYVATYMVQRSEFCIQPYFGGLSFKDKKEKKKKKKSPDKTTKCELIATWENFAFQVTSEVKPEPFPFSPMNHRAKDCHRSQEITNYKTFCFYCRGMGSGGGVTFL